MPGGKVHQGHLEGYVRVKKLQVMSAAVDASYKDGMYGCGYILSDGHWSIEFSDFSEYGLKENSMNFAELWGLYTLTYQIAHLRIDDTILIYFDDAFVTEIIDASFYKTRLKYKWEMSDKGREYLEAMICHISTLKGRIKLVKSKSPLHRGAHHLANLAQGLGLGRRTEAGVFDKAEHIVANLLP